MASEVKKENIYTIPEIAEWMKCSPASVSKLIKNKQLRAFKVLTDWRITETALSEFITKQEGIKN